jgi:hypothetical protein
MLQRMNETISFKFLLLLLILYARVIGIYRIVGSFGCGWFVIEYVAYATLATLKKVGSVGNK